MLRIDSGARLLVERLGGLPLALVTTGVYLQKSTLTLRQYLSAYERHWHIDRRRPLRLHEYQDRTLYTTFNVTYHRLEDDDPDVAQMLRLLAHFDHQEVWCELLQASDIDELFGGLRAALVDQAGSETVIRTLVEYCLVETRHVSSVVQYTFLCA